MRLTVRLLGTEVLHISTDADPEPERHGPDGDVTTYPVGFVAPRAFETDPTNTEREV